ncbi:3341_t:CDS:10 [Ambispora gerdemannii]|uniref:3341_t:CDS:1 n=1 Tax=Ambispora gerdemannii TaxID=144530 RepID=A0A9N8V6C7_9GLOM|nr:3341_t:CDS:10 [Ambispora gerdemannii]
MRLNAQGTDVGSRAWVLSCIPSSAPNSLYDICFVAVRSLVEQGGFRQRSTITGAFAPSTTRQWAKTHDFQIFESAMEHDVELPSFTVGYKNGFLPRQDPLARLPDRFFTLEYLLKQMPINLPDGNKGLLARGELGDAVKKNLPFYDVSDVTDQRLLSALFRDYTFLASAYLLEPCDIMYREKKNYGLGRQVLPKNIAVPLKTVADKIGANPFMEYALSYSLYNYQRIDPSKPITYPNLNLVRSFAGSQSEHGFILVHVAMVANSGNLVRWTMETMNSAAQQDRNRFNVALKHLNDTMETINQEMENMWERSNHEDYLKFRTFIMGSKNQPMFPNGVIYEGVSDKPLYYRGESGANDSMIPCMDNLLQITAQMPNNPLTEVLKDFRNYRPTNHKQFLEYVQKRAEDVNVRGFAVQDANSTALYLANMDQIRAFRHRHWNFTKEYIIKHTSHPVATGGSPIITWLPNQLSTVLHQMAKVGQTINYAELSLENRILVGEIVNRASIQERVLKREVSILKDRFGESQDNNRVVV